ncbi:protease modulator HflC [Dyella mobilis]|uniref:Protein HflC n=1 Tax=Dyella mobilis TaxID=1849582 RepID=A0ABS2KKJ4_9GAMM|nr:protease modulator HflC [Dyella mobilis]MBM7131687.1 protease modulator HflC [Dyella mobilis]GLQ96337.1 protein HflC [Dyella mobilis]
MKTTAAIIVVLALLLGFNSFYTVGEGHSALVLQFGQILRTDRQAGLHAKVPLLQQVLVLDDRTLSFDGRPERYVTLDKQSVNVDFYVKWRIDNPADYYRATGGDELQAGQRLSPIVSNVLRGIVDTRSLQQLVAGNPGELSSGTVQQANAQAQKALGISVVDVRITGIEFPDDIKAAVYKRMQTERQQQAAAIRADGKQEAEAIKADADRQAQVIRANAESEADKVKGEGDAQAAQIYAQAYGQDPDFFAFYRSLDAYKKAFGDGKGTIILKPDSEFLRYFGNPAPASARH